MGRLLDEDMVIDVLNKCQTYLFDARDKDLKIELRSAKLAIKELPSAQPEPTTEIQEILNYLDTTLHPIVSPDNWNVYAELHDMVSKLPSAQPEQIWILCDERMPEEHEWIGTKEFGTTISDEVYVTFENEKGERFCKHINFQNGELSRYDKTYMDAWYKDYKPIAWMPLPEPYEEDGADMRGKQE